MVSHHLLFDLSNRRYAVVNDSRDERGIRVAASNGVANVRRGPGTAARDDGDVDSANNRCREIEIISGSCTVAIDARDEKLACAATYALTCPLDCIE